jgi:hypothetical protein
MKPPQYMTDDEIVDYVVKREVFDIQQQRQFRNNPLAQPSLTKEQRDELEAVWREAQRRSLHGRIDKETERELGFVTKLKYVSVYEVDGRYNIVFQFDGGGQGIGFNRGASAHKVASALRVLADKIAQRNF